jgi:glutaredoxin
VGKKETILELKKQYTILQVKDFLINKQKAERCGTQLSTILFFYETKEKCPDCMKQSYVLDAIRATYPEVRVYSFDYTLELSTIEALKASYAVEGGLPVLVVDGKTQYGFQSLEALQRLLLSSKKAF